ncbi:hypothetical protein [Streptomyces rhizosphaericus]|uniref:Uncharacterized protein n=1 Tax=Streptomyces rhizosphaericus TaxID=114699 RepID=A0A6G4AR13_9ACTN|nr:hypothetical protein [Streptomyces rhizosphaericus]NEW74907.1 hypothetical protein [Streptomyces rhizosphaericus]
MRVERCLGPHKLFSGLVDQLEPEIPVDLGLVPRLGVGEDIRDRAQRLEHAADLVLGHPTSAGDLA